ncbi:MAG: pallilysin-related adhesin [Spirochaetales bacterium]|uniref:Pallilysin-related adhesin n=1 Tax=Candidatus Thalassospirochaeta sargassi TaxID=3119039 RepID=A0AAJ1MK28_9SPIO|nr:pallilysin-related adhesin [Spirochaetales bacterium]
MDEPYEPPEMVTEIIPSISDTDYDEDVYAGSSFNLKSDKPLIEISSEDVLLNTLNLNLDLDTHEEQILVTKKKSSPEGKIHLIVADYSNVTKSYIRAWESETSAENIRSFMVYLDDLIGDHNNEIVCTGRDSQGRTTLDVFWKNTADNQLGYGAVFSNSAMGTIEINQQERSRAYHQGLKNGVSYTVTVTSETDGPEDNPGLTKSIYFWDFPLRRYVLLSEEKLESEAIVENRITEVINGDEEKFYEFISGPWYKDERIMYFDPENKSSTFYSDDIQENYSWSNSYKVMSNLLYTRGRNDIINYIENEIYIRIIALDEVMITVRDIDNQTRKKSENDIWTGRYLRMNNEMQADTITDIDSVLNYDNLPVLSGQYISDSGDIIEFYGSDFYLKNSFEEIKGGFAVYSADIDILNLKIIDSKGIVSEERSFALNYTEEIKQKSIERVLVLTPGSLSIYGFHVSDTEFFRFTQIETLEITPEETQ